MKNKKLAIGISALTAMVISTGFISSVAAYQGDPSVQGPNHTAERHKAMMQAFETRDYNAWVEARGDVARGRIMDVINEDNFSKFVEMRELRLAGDIDGANAIRAELGLGQGRMKRGSKGGNRHGNRTREQNRGGNFIDANGDGVCDNQ